MAVVYCDGLSRWHGKVIAVNDVTWSVEPGITGLLGPNGAGKTTLFRLMMGLQKPSSGTIEVLGEDPWDNPGLLKRIGYVPDGSAPFQRRTGLQAATYLGQLSGMSKADAQAHAIAALDRVGILEHKDRKVGEYSRGMQQRLKFGFALMQKPEIMLLDEPLIATDPLTRRDLVKLMRDMAREGISVVISTHVLPDVEALTERIALLNRGRLVAHGDVHHIRDLLDRHPRTVFVETTAPREMGLALQGMESVMSVESGEAGVTVRTKQPQVFFDQLQRLLLEKSLPFTAITPLDDNVEAIFRYLVSES